MTTKTFPAYTFTVRPVVVYEHIFDDKSKQIRPIKTMDGVEVHEVLDIMALAMEAGAVNTHSWPQQLFASRKAFDEFIEQLACYDDCFRITDQWWQALDGICDHGDEEGFITTRDIAEAIVEAAQEDGLLNNWGKKTPVYKYSEKQCEEALYQMVVYYERLNNNRTSVTDAQRAEQSRLNEITSFGSKYYGTTLSPERKAQAIAEAAPAKAAAKTSAAKVKAAKKMAAA